MVQAHLITPAARAEVVGRLIDRAGLEELDVTRLLPAVAWTHLAMGEVVQAAAVVAQAARRARMPPIQVTLVDALRVQAVVVTRQRHWEEAERALEEGLALVRSTPYPYAEACRLYGYGAMHAQKGEPGPACEWLEAALAIVRRLRARKHAERVEQALRTLLRVPPPDAAGPAPDMGIGIWAV